MPIEYSFSERLKMSEGVDASADVESILLGHIPGALSVIKAHSKNDRTGVDWWVEMPGARFLAVDAKVREQDWTLVRPEEDDLALETWSVVEQRIPGWTRCEDKNCDYVLWLWIDTGRFCLLPFRMLCKVFSGRWEDWSKKYRTARQYTPRNGGGYHSECVFVDRRELWAEMYRQFGGAPVKGAP